MDALGARGIRFNLAQAGATTPEMLEPLSKRVDALGWHIQIGFASGWTLLERSADCREREGLAVLPVAAEIDVPCGDHPLRALVLLGAIGAEAVGRSVTRNPPPVFSLLQALFKKTPLFPLMANATPMLASALFVL